MAMTDFFWEGLILATVFGMSLGSYATSLIHRLPNRLPWFADRNPYCPSCDTYLETRDLFPLFSYWLNKRQCRFCAAPIPARYFWVEVGCTASSVIPYVALGFSEAYVIWTLLGCALTILAAIYVSHRRLSVEILAFIAMLAIAWRVLEDGTLAPLVMRGFVIMVFGQAIRYASARWLKRSFAAEWIVLAMLLGLLA